MIQAQKLQFYELVQENKLDWHRFKFSESKNKGQIQIKIEYDNSEYYFKYTYKTVKPSSFYDWITEYSPGHSGDPIRSDIIGHGFFSIIKEFKNWLKVLIVEIDAFIFFERLKHSQINFSDFTYSNFDFEDRFTQDEIDNIQNRILGFKENIAAINLSIEQLDEINQKLDYLIDRSKKLPKIDWINIFISTIVQFTIAGAADLAKNIPFVSYLKDLMHNIFNPLKIIS